VRVGLVSYANPFVWGGGGELALRELVLAGRAQGHEVHVFSVWPRASGAWHMSRPDGWILADIHNLPKRQGRVDQRLLTYAPWTTQSNFRRVLEQALAGRYVHFDNAYVDTCNQGYLPCGGGMASRSCPCTRGNPAFRIRTGELYRGARACFVVSPLHAEILSRLQPDLGGPVVIVRPTLNPEPFIRARRADRDIEWLWVGALTRAKGADRLGDLQGLTIIAPRKGHVDVPNASSVVLGVPYEDMPGFFGRANRFVFRPRWPEPLGRVVAEAALAGCELHLEGSIGACSFDADLSDPAFYEGARDEFWTRLEEVLA
jgi:glycosyltransferase involved in cell wall biosynthesis